MASNRPRAFRLREAENEPFPLEESPVGRGAVAIAPDRSLDADLAGDSDLPQSRSLALAPRRRRWMSFGSVLAFALSGLALIGLSTTIERGIVSLFEENAWLGGLASALAGLALLGLLGRETLSIWRQRRITAMREEAAGLRESRDIAAATAFVAALSRLYVRRPETARARGLLAGLERDVLDPADRLAVAERELILPLDIEAPRLVASCAQRFSFVTSLAPRAV